MGSGLPEGKRIFSRSFYGFDPTQDGYVGWTVESSRDTYLNKLNDGDLMLIFGANSAQTHKAAKATVLGFVEIEHAKVMDRDAASPESLASKKAHDWADRWTFGIPIRRAWMAREPRMFREIAFMSYDPKAGQGAGLHGLLLKDEEVEEALKIKVQEVSVWGRPALPEAKPVTSFAQALQPSRAFPGSHGLRDSVYEDGESWLYLARFEGDGHALLGRRRQIGDKSVALKIGVTNSITRRQEELNSGIPPTAPGKWSMARFSQPFPEKAAAEEAEQ